MTVDIDWGRFPEPYDRELPFYIDEAYKRLSPEGVRLLDIVVAACRGPLSALAGGAGGAKALAESLDSEDLERRFAGLPEWDLMAVVAINQPAKRALEALADRERGKADLFRQMLGLFRRAGELDPGFAASVKRDEATLQEAIAVLERHGIKPGLSEELMEMRFEVLSHEGS